MCQLFAGVGWGNKDGAVIAFATGPKSYLKFKQQGIFQSGFTVSLAIQFPQQLNRLPIHLP